MQAFRQSLEAAARATASKTPCCVEALVAQASASILEVQAIHARHIAESDDAAMSQMEAEMSAAQAGAQKALDTLKGQLPPSAGPHLAAAAAALERFNGDQCRARDPVAPQQQRPIAGLVAGPEAHRDRRVRRHSSALEDALAKHDFTATR